MILDKQEAGGGGNDVLDQSSRLSTIAPLLPADFEARREGSGIRLLITERDRLNERSGSLFYVFKHAADVDTSTKEGRDAGYARAEIVDQVVAPGTAELVGSKFITNARFQSGVFFCYAIDGQGNVSADYLTSQQLTTEVLDTSIPDDVGHLFISESGEEITPGVIASMLSVSLRMPNPLGSAAKVQLFLKDYTRLGVIEEGASERFIGEPGGSLQFKVPHALVRRQGTGDITFTNASANVNLSGGALLSEAQAGEQFEFLGKRLTILTVNANTGAAAATLAAPWPDATITSSQWAIVPLVTVYVVTISKGGTHRVDVENAPSVRVLFDGDISPPNPPTILSATAMGNVIRVDVQQPIGTALEKINLHRGTGAGQAFEDCLQIDSQYLNRAVGTTGGGNLQFSDMKFTTFERESGTTFTYYVSVTNQRGDVAVSDPAEAICRLDGSGDTDPSVPARSGPKNYLFNSFIGGNGVAVAGTPFCVSNTDATQDVFNFFPAVVPGAAGKLLSWTRWHGTTTGTAGTTNPGHNGRYVYFPAPGSGKQNYIYQEILAWDTATGTSNKFRKEQIVVFSGKVRKVGSPTGNFSMYLEPYNAGAAGKYSPRRYRDVATDDWTETDPTNATAGAYNIACSEITTEWSRFFAIFRLDGDQGTGPATPTTKFRINFGFSNSTVGEIQVMEVMLADGEELSAWTADMIEPTQSEPPGFSGDQPRPTGDSPGHRDKIIP